MRRSILLLIAVLAVACSPALALIASSPPQAGGIALVIGRPFGMPAHQVAVQAQVQEISPLRAPFGVLVHLSGSQQLEALFRNGALFVINGERILWLCKI